MLNLTSNSLLTAWLMTGDVQKLVVVVSDQKTKETKERWNFDIQMDKEVSQTYASSDPFSSHSTFFLTFVHSAAVPRSR